MPKMRLPIPCQTPRWRRGTRSEVTKVVMQVRPPPPIPAMTRPAMTSSAEVARPQISVPTAKKMLEKTRP